MDLNLECCYCGREYCDFFNGAVGDYGESYSIQDVEEYLKELPAIKAHLEKELEKAKAVKHVND